MTLAGMVPALESVDINVLVGLTMAKVEVCARIRLAGSKSRPHWNGEDEVRFESTCGRVFRLYHSQDCCESVDIEDVCGDVEDLIGSPILMAEEATSPDEDSESGTWTFYKLATVKGYVTIRWLGRSNGYYSESVYFEEVRV